MGQRTLSMSAISKTPTINGWTANADKFCAGLPGALPPMGEFDPLGFTDDLSVAEIKRYREAEVTHGRVSMLAVMGYLVGENFHHFSLHFLQLKFLHARYTEQM